MRIKTQLIAAASAAAAVAVLVGACLAYVTDRAQAGIARRADSQRIAHDVLSMLSLTNEFIVFGGQRVAAQWRAHHAQLRATVQTTLRRQSVPPAELLELTGNIDDLSPLFDALVELGEQPPSPLSQRRRELILERMLSETQEVLQNRDRWSSTIAEAQRGDQRLYTAIVLTAPAILLLLLAALAVLVWRKVLKPLLALQTAVAAMEAGDLAVRCASQSRDELGDTSRAVDAMALALQRKSDELQLSEQRLQLSERQLRGIADNLPALISYIDRDERFSFLNATFAAWFDIDPVTSVGRSLADVTGAAAYEARAPWIKRALAGERVEFNTEAETLLGRKSLHLIYVPDVQADGTVAGFFVHVSDVTLMKNVERQLNDLARVDALTQLPDRRQFEEKLAEGLARAVRARQPIALMFLDIDHFKAINDSSGHAVGDAVLKEFAARLKRVLRSTDTPARLAGDEFVIMLEGLHDRDEAELVAGKVVATIREPFHLGGARLLVTASMGVAYCARPNRETPLMECADEALYSAKDAGRNTFAMRSMEPVVTGFGDLEMIAADAA